MTDQSLATREAAVVEGVTIDQGKILKYLGLRDDDPAAQAAVLICQRYGLDPILKHVVLIEENQKDDDGKWQKVGRVYITRDGLLHNAHNSGHLDGIEEVIAPHLNDEGTHWVARVAVYRDDKKRAFSYTGRFPRTRKRWTGPKNERTQVDEEHPYGPEMAIKVSESMSLRRAFNISAPVQEERWDREDVQEAAIVDELSKDGGLPAWVNELVDAHGPDAVREAGGVDFLEKLTDADEARVRAAFGQESEAEPPEVVEAAAKATRPKWADALEAEHGEELLLEGINDVRDAHEPEPLPLKESLEDVAWDRIGSDTVKHIEEAIARRVNDAKSEKSDAEGNGGDGAANEGETVPTEQTVAPSSQELVEHLKDLNVTDAMRLVNDLDDVKELERVQDAELRGKCRKTVMGAIASKIQELPGSVDQSVSADNDAPVQEALN